MKEKIRYYKNLYDSEYYEDDEDYYENHSEDSDIIKLTQRGKALVKKGNFQEAYNCFEQVLKKG